MFGDNIGEEENSEKYPVQKRSCTDVIFAIIFLAFWVFCLVGVIMGFKEGDIKNITQTFDGVGSKCGSGNATGYPYMFITGETKASLTDPYTSRYLCVKSCPANNETKLECLPNKKVTDCSKVQVFDTFLVANSYCVPRNKEGIKSIKTNALFQGFDKRVEDIADVWPIYFICVGFAFLISAAYCYLLEHCAGIVITVLIVTLLAALIYLGVLMWRKYQKIHNDDDPDDSGENWFYYGAIIFWCLAGYLSLMVCCLWGRITLAISVIRAAADFITDHHVVMLLPILNTFCCLAFFIYWMFGAAYIYSNGDVIYKEGYPYGKLNWGIWNRIFWYCHLFSLLWNMSFLIYFSHFTIAVMAVTWYYAKDKYNLNGAFCKSIKWGIFYHYGSLAFGSLILAIIWAIQIMLAYIQEKVETEGSPDNCIIKVFLKIIICIVACFERLIKFLSGHAFIEVAMRSVSFCEGATNAMSLILSNALRIGILHGICTLVISFGAVAITAITVIFCYMILCIDYFEDKLTSMVGPLLVCIIIAFIISHLWGHVFSVASDSMIHCYLTEDKEDGEDHHTQQGQQRIGGVIQHAKEKNDKLAQQGANAGYNPVTGNHGLKHISQGQMQVINSGNQYGGYNN